MLRPGFVHTEALVAQYPSPADPPPGWYDDPDLEESIRWWDGEDWTEHTLPAGRRMLQRVPAGAVAAPYPVNKSRTTAGVLGLLFGGFGAHRFYMGHTGIGIAQVAVTVCTLGIGSLWGFVEGIMILTRAPGLSTDAWGRPLTD